MKYALLLIACLAPEPINFEHEIIKLNGENYEVRWEDNRMDLKKVNGYDYLSQPPIPPGMSFLGCFNGFLYGGWFWALMILGFLGEWEVLSWVFSVGIVIFILEYHLIDWWEKRK